MQKLVAALGESVIRNINALGFGMVILYQILVLIGAACLGRHKIRLSEVVDQTKDTSVDALFILTLLSAAIGAMLAIQGLYSLRRFGAESQVEVGVAFSVVREFSALITGILVAGRSGSALTARIGMMKINQELDALTVMGIDPLRHLGLPPMIALVIMMPLLTLWANLVSLLAAGLYISIDLNNSLLVYANNLRYILRLNDIFHGLSKACLFAVLIVLVGITNGLMAEGGALGVGKMTTRSVVRAISWIIIFDMIFAFAVTR